MKKTIIAALALVALTTGASFAQRGYPPSSDNRSPQYSNSRQYGNNAPQYGGRYDNDQRQDDLKIDRIDAIVGLSRRQKKQLHKIEDSYDRTMATARMTPDGARQLQLRKRQDMLAVLTSAQRDRLFAQRQQQSYQRPNAPYGGRRY